MFGLRYQHDRCPIVLDAIMSCENIVYSTLLARCKHATDSAHFVRKPRSPLICSTGIINKVRKDNFQAYFCIWTIICGKTRHKDQRNIYAKNKLQS